MEDDLFLSVVIPAYNKEEGLSKTLIDIDNYLSEQNFNYEIIVVNDGSTDTTSEVVYQLKNKVGNLDLIDNKINRGKRFAVRQGMLKAKGKLALAKNLGYKIKEAPVSWVDSQKSTVILKSYFLVLFEALKAKWWLWTKNYNL